MAELTPMMAQYRSVKERFSDSILFFRLGDFYEMFEKDAIEASSLLDLTLTQRSGVPMCGVPYHAAASYISRLLSAGQEGRDLRAGPRARQGVDEQGRAGGDHPGNRAG